MVTKERTRIAYGALVSHGRRRLLIGAGATAIMEVLARRGLRMDRDDLFNLACMTHSTLYPDLDETIDALIGARLVKDHGDGIVSAAGGTLVVSPVDSEKNPQWFQGLDLSEPTRPMEEHDDLPDVTVLAPGEQGVTWE
jgi:hypothetical protein